MVAIPAAFDKARRRVYDAAVSVVRQVSSFTRPKEVVGVAKAAITPKETSVEEVRRLLALAELYYRRFRFEQQLVAQGREPRFRLSWDRLKRSFGHRSEAALQRLEKFAEDDSDAALHAFGQAAVQTAVSVEPLEPTG